MNIKAAAVAVVVVMVVAACSGADGDDTAGLPRFTAPPSPAASRPASSERASEAPETERIIAAYRTYTAAVSQVLAEGDARLPALRAAATGQALADARARVRANRRDGVAAIGALEPSATVAQVTWSGGDRATVSDCVLNGLGHVQADDPEVVVAEATGTRRPVRARVSRTSGGWVVSHVQMPQDEDTANPQTDPPFLRGPMPDGPPSCAPAQLEVELLARYQAFWDAFDRAFGFGRDGPADPDDPGLADTQVDPQLSDTREFFTELRDKNQTSRGEPDTRDPWVLAVADFDQEAFIADCVTLGDSQTVDLDTGEIIERNNAGQLNYYETHLRAHEGVWQVRNWEVIAEGVEECEPPG